MFRTTTSGGGWCSGDISNFDYDYVTIKYDSLGNQLWLDRYSGESDGSDTARDLAIDPGGNVYVTGSSDGPDGICDDFATVKYVQEAADTTESPSLSLSMPNPCRGDAFFQVNVPGSDTRAVVQVFDLRGRLVRTLLDEVLRGSADVHWDGQDAAAIEQPRACTSCSSRPANTARPGRSSWPASVSDAGSKQAHREEPLRWPARSW